MATEKVLTKSDADAIAVVALESPSDNVPGSSVEKADLEFRRPMATKRALIAWLVLCFSVSYPRRYKLS
jgi:hypothetical protein